MVECSVSQSSHSPRNLNSLELRAARERAFADTREFGSWLKDYPRDVRATAREGTFTNCSNSVGNVNSSYEGSKGRVHVFEVKRWDGLHVVGKTQRVGRHGRKDENGAVLGRESCRNDQRIILFFQLFFSEFSVIHYSLAARHTTFSTLLVLRTVVLLTLSSCPHRDLLVLLRSRPRIPGPKYFSSFSELHPVTHGDMEKAADNGLGTGSIIKK